MPMRHQILASLLVAACAVLNGCSAGEIAPPENPPELVVDDFPACVVKINGETLSDKTIAFESGTPLDIEVALTYREGVDPERVMPCMLHIIKRADDAWDNVAYEATRPVEGPTDAPENILHFQTEWTPELEPGTYGLFVGTTLQPEDIFADGPPISPVAYGTIEVRE